MKKLLIGLVVVAIVAGAAWCGRWYTGRGQVADQMDLELARLEASGTHAQLMADGRRYAELFELQAAGYR